MRLLKYLALFAALFYPPALRAQTAELSPPALANVPKGATAANPFWQHLVITLSRNPSAGNTLTINLPAGVSVADVDGDGRVDDEVSIDDETSAGSGYGDASGTTAGQIVLGSTTGGQAGRIHVQFPIRTPSNPAAASAVYGQISFSNSGERPIPAGTLTLTFVEARQLQLATFSQLFVESAADTTTSPQGDAYPQTAEPAFALPLPDLVSDRRGNLGSAALSVAGAPFADGSDSNDATYTFWFSKRDTLASIDTTVAVPARNRATGQVVRVNEGSAASIAFDTAVLQDSTYFLYMTSNLTGRFPLMRSRGIRVRHLPVVLSVGRFQGDDADFLDSGLLLDFDKGRPGRPSGARRSVDLVFRVADFDDSATVRLFYATSDTLDTTFVLSTGSAPNRLVTGLTGGKHVDSLATLREGRDSLLVWNIASNDTTFVARGDYYIYAVISDGKSLGIGRSAFTYRVRHSPFLAMDSRQSQTLNTGGEAPQRYYAITWNSDNGKDGDVALTDSARISLYYSASDSFAVPGGTTALQAAAADSTRDTHLIVAGLQEQSDSRQNNQYVWDLWTYRNPDDGRVPRAGVRYSLYGVIEADTTRRLVRWEDESGQARHLRFLHEPHLRVRAPLAALQADGRQSFAASWEARDVDQEAGIWVLLTGRRAGQDLGEQTTYAALIADTTADWVANSFDGSLEKAQAISEDSTRSLAVRPSRLVRDLRGAARPIGDGEYYVYVVIDSSTANPPTDGSPAFRAPGLVTLSGLAPTGAGGLAAPALEILPANLVLSAPSDTATLEFRPHAAGQSVDLVACFASLDTLFLRVVDQDPGRTGIQPFKLAAGLQGLVLRDTLLAGSDSTTAGKWLMDLVYFEQEDNARFDGDFVLATAQVVSKDTVGTTEIRLDHAGRRQTALYRDGEAVALLPPAVAARATLSRRASISGRVLLQGRRNHRSLVTFSLRDRNNFLPLIDARFAAANDADSLRPGIQDTTDVDGRFTLARVPAGDYHLAVHIDGFLDGQYPKLRVDPGLALTGIDPTFLADGETDAGFLLGGDVTGYVDTSGASIPDNEIDQLDVDFVVGFFGQKTSASHAGRLADIDGDSLVWVADLNLVAANFRREGVAPVYKAAAASGGAGRWLLNWEEVGGELRVEVGAEALEGARAYGFRLLYDEERLRLLTAEPGALFAGRPMVLAHRRGEGEIAFGNALAGDQEGVWGNGELARLRFARREGTEGPVHLELADAVWVDGAHRLHHPQEGASRPAAYALLANYPNPFNPQTALRFALPRESEVVLEIYDMAGQKVRTLVRGRWPAGLHTAIWDGRDTSGARVGSGAYFARLRAGPFSATHKMLLLQ